MHMGKTSDEEKCVIDKMLVTKQFLLQHCCSLVLYSHGRTSLRSVYSLCKRKYCNENLCMICCVSQTAVCQDMLAINI